MVVHVRVGERRLRHVRDFRDLHGDGIVLGEVGEPRERPLVGRRLRIRVCEVIEQVREFGVCFDELERLIQLPVVTEDLDGGVRLEGGL